MAECRSAATWTVLCPLPSCYCTACVSRSPKAGCGCSSKAPGCSPTSSRCPRAPPHPPGSCFPRPSLEATAPRGIWGCSGLELPASGRVALGRPRSARCCGVRLAPEAWRKAPAKRSQGGPPACRKGCGVHPWQGSQGGRERPGLDVEAAAKAGQKGRYSAQLRHCPPRVFQRGAEGWCAAFRKKILSFIPCLVP